MDKDSEIKILYVDDEVINLQLFENVFKKIFKVYTAISGKDGLSILKKNPEIGVVISDMKMPEMDGVDFILLAKEKNQNLISYIFTAYNINQKIDDAIKNKAINRCFKKPFKKLEIIEEIRNAVNGKS